MGVLSQVATRLQSEENQKFGLEDRRLGENMGKRAYPRLLSAVRGEDAEHVAHRRDTRLEVELRRLRKVGLRNI